MKLISLHALVSVLVRDQEEALHFYTEMLGLEKRSDITFGPGLRLLTVASQGQEKPEIALACPDVTLHGEMRVQELLGHIGEGAPRIFVTENCRRDYEQLQARGVAFRCQPTAQLYGVEAIFDDPFGNSFVLLEASPEARSLFAQYHVEHAA
jgi:catechol 2,3-dioxygenase-like lactoylglutathione lyase family enzyme